MILFKSGDFLEFSNDFNFKFSNLEVWLSPIFYVICDGPTHLLDLIVGHLPFIFVDGARVEERRHKQHGQHIQYDEIDVKDECRQQIVGEIQITEAMSLYGLHMIY